MIADGATDWRAERALQAGRMAFFVEQLLALDRVRNEVPAGYLRTALHRLAEHAGRTEMPAVEAPEVEQFAAAHRGEAEFWRYDQNRKKAAAAFARR